MILGCLIEISSKMIEISSKRPVFYLFSSPDDRDIIFFVIGVILSHFIAIMILKGLVMVIFNGL